MKPMNTLKRIGFVLLILIAAVLAVRAVFIFLESRALTRALAELKAQGVPLAALDLTPPCSDEDNGARLWRAAENLLVLDAPGTRPKINPMDVRPIGRSELSGAFKMYAEGEPLDPARKAGLRELASRNARALELMAEAGSKPCFLRRDASASMIDSLTPGSSSAVKMIQVTQLLGFASLFAAENGDLPGAIEKLRGGLRFAPRPAGERTLIMYLVAVAGTRSLVHFLQDVCGGRPVGDDTLARLIEDFDPVSWRERLAGAWRGERVILIEAAQFATSGRRGSREALFGKMPFLQGLGFWLVRPFVIRDFRKTLPLYEELDKAARLPYFESRDALKTLTGTIAERPWYAFFTGALVPNFESAYLKEAMLEATLLAARTGLACRLYKSREGGYPEGLSSLVPGVLGEVPIDPFTGKPLVYRREGEGFIVYSLGSNQKDDAGRSTYNITGLVMDKDDDWTWREPR